MRIAIRKEPNGSIYIDKNLRKDIPYTEPPYNFTIIEVEKEDCVAIDFNDDLTFNIEKYNARLNQFKLNNELNELVSWFDGYYRTQVEQYNRCQRTGAVYDKDIVELDKQADDAQKRIREIKEQLKISQTKS